MTDPFAAVARIRGYIERKEYPEAIRQAKILLEYLEGRSATAGVKW